MIISSAFIAKIAPHACNNLLRLLACPANQVLICGMQNAKIRAIKARSERISRFSELKLSNWRLSPARVDSALDAR
jgi:hypothetical protein